MVYFARTSNCRTINFSIIGIRSATQSSMTAREKITKININANNKNK